jgi:DNA-binding response OmpR family regulator
MVSKVVLLVTPDHAQLSMTATALRMRGFTVMWAESGQAALAAVRASLPAAVVVEYPFQVQQGLELLSELQAARAEGTVKVAAVTAHGLPLSDLLIIEQRVDLLLVMPVPAAVIGERTVNLVKALEG